VVGGGLLAPVVFGEGSCVDSYRFHAGFIAIDGHMSSERSFFCSPGLCFFCVVNVAAAAMMAAAMTQALAGETPSNFQREKNVMSPNNGVKYLQGK